MLLRQSDEPGVGGAESASLEIKSPQVRVKIDVEPLAAGVFRPFNRLPYQGLCNALALEIRRHHRIQNKCVDTAIPRDVNEPDQLLQTTTTHPTETEAINLGPPVINQDSMLEALGMKGVDLGIPERSTPLGRVIGRYGSLR